MSRNRLTGDALTTSLLPVAAGGTFSEGLTDDYLMVPAAFAAGTHIVTLNGAIAGQAVPGDGDQLDICDPLGLLGPGTKITVTGKISGLGAQIQDGAALANSITMNRPGEHRQFTFSSAAAGGVGAWISEDRKFEDESVVIADAVATTINWGQGTWRTLVATQANAITLDVGQGERKGDEIFISRNDVAAFAVTIINGGPGAGTLGVLVASKRGFFIAHFDGTNWVYKAMSAQ